MPRELFVIGVSGGPSSGKTAVCKMIMDKLDTGNKARVQYIDQSSFYRPLASADKLHNFDHPEAIDWEALENTIKALKDGQETAVRVYSMKERMMGDETVVISPDIDILLVEGTLLLYSDKIRDQLDIKLFVDVDSDVRLSRRVVRDSSLLGRDLDAVLKEYVQFVKPSFEDFILPTKKRADIILPRGEENAIAIDMIVQHINKWIGGTSTYSRPKASIVSDMLYMSSPSLPRLNESQQEAHFQTIIN